MYRFFGATDFSDAQPKCTTGENGIHAGCAIPSFIILVPLTNGQFSAQFLSYRSRIRSHQRTAAFRNGF